MQLYLSIKTRCFQSLMTESYTLSGASSTWRTKVRTSGKISSSQLFHVNGSSLADWFSDTPSVVSSGIDVRCLMDGYPMGWLVDEDIVLIKYLIAICWCCAMLCCAVIRYAMLRCIALCYAVLSVLCWVFLQDHPRVLLACTVVGPSARPSNSP